MWNIYLRLGEVLSSINGLRGDVRQLSNLVRQVARGQTKEIAMTQALNDSVQALQAEVAADSTVINSATIVINGIADRIAAAIAGAADDSAAVSAVQGVVSTLKSNVSALSAAVVANTPAAATPPESPPATA